MKKILVIDGNSIINRAFYGVRPLSTKSGKPTNAIYGMINIIERQMSRIKPDYAAVAFDLKAPTFRHKMYEHYKEGRHPTPDDLKAQFADAKECLKLMGFAILEMEGYEADDLQGTVAHMAHGADDTESYILSGDRDLLQLIDDKITVLLATNKDTLVMKREEFLEKYGIEPCDFVDMKALMGDSSDNIPGVAGVGEKTAQSLIQNFKNLDGIYENINDKKISEGVRTKLLRDKDNAYLSYKLAKINTEVPMKENLSDLEYKGFDKAGLYKKFNELELNSFIVKFALTAEEDKQEALDTVALTEFKKVDGKKINSLSGLNAIYKNDSGIYIYNINEGNLHFDGEISEISDFLSNADLICYDGKPLWHDCARHGIKPAGKLLDLMMYAYLLNPGSGNAGIPPLVSMFLSKSVDANAPCPELLFELEGEMRKKIEEDGLSELLFEVEIPLITTLAKIEDIGFKINAQGMLEYAEALDSLARDLTESIYFRAGREFNINSPKQLAEVLFDDLGLPANKKRSTSAEVLEELRPYSPIIDDIFEYRQVTKLKGTYASVLPTLADEKSRIHTDFKQALTATGRLSSADPNLQNIPIKTKMGREMRRYFVAEDGYTLVDADYSQIELRLLAHISDDYTMCEAFKSGTDIHTKTAAAVFGIPEEEVTERERKRAKAVNFGIVYGIGGFSLAKDIGTTTAEATKYIKNYLMNYPSVERYLEDVVGEATERGYTATPMGRRRYIPELNAKNGILRAFGKRVAMNAPIQGAAADIMKVAMLRVEKALEKAGLDAKIVMQVHDELVVEVLDSQKEECAEIVKREMENAVKLSIPLTVEVTSGKNWLEQY